MRLLPFDFGLPWHLALLKRRASGPLSVEHDVALEPTSPRIGLLGRLWSAGLSMPPRSAAAALATLEKHCFLPTSACIFLGGALVTGIVAALFRAFTGHGLSTWQTIGVLYSGNVLATLIVPRLFFQRLHRRPVTVDEVNALLEFSAADTLEQDYLWLTRDLIAAPVPDDSEADLHAAVRLLGQIVAQIRPMPDVCTAEALEHQARSLRRRAQEETDPVRTAGMERQSVLLEFAALIILRSRVLFQNGEMLRGETRRLIEAARQNLAIDTRTLEALRRIAEISEPIAQVHAELRTASVGLCSEPLRPDTTVVRSRE